MSFGNSLDVNYFDRLDVNFEEIVQDGALIPRLYAEQYYGEPRPIYRHIFSGNATMMNPTVLEIRDKIMVQFPYDFNHVLIQYYRDGKDFIGKHSDKTVDMDDFAPIITVSFYDECDLNRGANLRKIRMRNKMDKSYVDYELPNKSVFHIDLETNRNFLHEIKKTENAAKRISLTFRKINTFLINGELIGKGRGITNLLEGFSRENKTTEKNIYVKN